MIRAFEKGGGKGKPMYLKIQLSYAKTHEQAMAGAYDQWRTNVLPHDKLGDLSKPEHFDKAAKEVTQEDVAKMVHISANLEEHVQWLQQYIDLGFENLILHNVNREQQLFIRDFGREVLPALKAYKGKA